MTIVWITAVFLAAEFLEVFVMRIPNLNEVQKEDNYHE